MVGSTQCYYADEEYPLWLATQCYYTYEEYPLWLAAHSVTTQTKNIRYGWQHTVLLLSFMESIGTRPFYLLYR
jgi:hypothetical protein